MVGDAKHLTEIMTSLKEVADGISTDDLGYLGAQAQIDQWTAIIKGAGFDDFVAGMVMMVFLVGLMHSNETKQMTTMLGLSESLATAMDHAMKLKLLKAAAIGMRLHA